MIAPMLAQPEDEVPIGEYAYELKWDGIRAIIVVKDGKPRIQSRSGRAITSQFPELQESGFGSHEGTFDGEIIWCAEDGKPSYDGIMQRVNSEKVLKSENVHCCLFDALAIDGSPLLSEPWSYRREKLERTVVPHPSYRLSEVFDDGEALMDACRELDLEGIMAKRLDGTYSPGRRSNAWIKVKVMRVIECRITGYTKGKGKRANTFGALQVSDMAGDPMGLVGSGFDEESIEKITVGLKADKQMTCRIQFMSKTEGGLREPVFLHLT